MGSSTFNLINGFNALATGMTINAGTSTINLTNPTGCGFSGGGFVYVLKFDGTVYPGWPKAVTQWIYGPPAVGYINNDNFLDIAIGDQVLSGVPTDYVNAWDRNGNSLLGFPIGPVNAVNDQILLADIDNDNMIDSRKRDNDEI